MARILSKSAASAASVMSYPEDFLFSPARAKSPVKSLSGGERNRLLLAQLFTRPANVLVLDEPTNDLDIDTLELLEQLLADYSGTVFWSATTGVSDNVATQVIAFEGDGVLMNTPAAIATGWLPQRMAELAALARTVAVAPVKPTKPKPAPSRRAAATSSVTMKPVSWSACPTTSPN